MPSQVRSALLGLPIALGLTCGAAGPAARGQDAPAGESKPPAEKVEPLKIEGDLKEMQGKWVSKDEQGESVWDFHGERVTLKTPTRGYEMIIKVNAKGAPEKHIDFDVLQDSPNAKGYKAMGIYKFADDGALKIAFGDGDSGRPKEFKTDFGKTFAFDLKRKK